LLEWTYVDRRWHVPHIELARERLIRLVHELSIPEKPASLRILQTIGIVEDFRERAKRFGIISRLPGNCDVLREPVVLNDFFPRDSTTLSELPEPLLSERFRLALTIATAVHELHSSGWLHKEINSFNIAFLYSNDSPSISVQEPYMTGFGYARPDTEDVVSLVVSSAGKDIYKHPDLRGREHNVEGQQVPRFKRKYDIYSFGLVLLEIGLWDSVSTFDTNLATPQAFTDRLVRVCKRDLGHRMGRTYRDVAIRCIEGIKTSTTEPSDSNDQRAEESMSFYWSVVRELAKCQCK
jgi:serine/threonine protein kinase